ncbi:MAG: DUF2207 domain-containing protein [Dermatophilus congolensis]|nr:DUF2207 domain-containing protein [Dermatophilus congolensis]
MTTFMMLVLIVLVVAVLSRMASGDEKRGGIGGPGKNDEIFAGVAPGVIPTLPSEAPVRRLTRDDANLPIAVRFEPPEGVVPEESGVLAYRGTQGRDIAAAFVSMAVEGWYRIEQLAPENTDAAAQASRPQGAGGASGAGQWRLLKDPTRDDNGLDPLRRDLYRAIFAAGPVVTLDEAKATMADAARSMRRGLDAGALEKGWYAARGRHVSRTALGSALNYQTVGFREYLGRAESHQITFEEAAGIFSRFLPWAVALGVADQWAGHFAGIADEVTDPAILDLWATDLIWWVGMDALLGGAIFGGLGEAIGSLGDAMTDFAGEIADFGGDLFDGDLGDGLGLGDGGGDGGDMGDGGGDVGGGDDGGFFGGLFDGDGFDLFD